ncbi:hypothetical protein H5410_015840 [Solanum commersonii]|uniref:Uncharacterized protein n=1 Tax=Solanum commersonii TaxID=4109 RepID=A0A9J5ZUY3_SOLCO|nr:hypothetical protein H5410_015840 [Solanum commersonii]
MPVMELFPPKSDWRQGYPMLFGLFKNVNGCVSDSPKVVYFWRIRHEGGIKSEESTQLTVYANLYPYLMEVEAVSEGPLAQVQLNREVMRRKIGSEETMATNKESNTGHTEKEQ